MQEISGIRNRKIPAQSEKILRATARRSLDGLARQDRRQIVREPYQVHPVGARQVQPARDPAQCLLRPPQCAKQFRPLRFLGWRATHADVPAQGVAGDHFV